MDHLLRIAEASEDTAVSNEMMKVMTAPWLSADRLQSLSYEFWGFLNFNVIGQARQVFENAGDLQGFEAWRKLVKLVRSRAEIRKLELSDKVRRPMEAKKLSEMTHALEVWEAGGRAP